MTIGRRPKFNAHCPNCDYLAGVRKSLGTIKAFHRIFICRQCGYEFKRDYPPRQKRIVITYGPAWIKWNDRWIGPGIREINAEALRLGGL